MIDIFTVVVPHVLMAIAIWRLIHRDDIAHDPILSGPEPEAASVKRGFHGGQKTATRNNGAPGA